MDDDPVVDALNALADRVEGLIHEEPEPPASGTGVYVPHWAMTMVLGLLSTAVIALTVFVFESRERLSLIEGTMMTVIEAQEMRREIENGIPPDDVLRRLTEHERRLDRIEGN